MNKFSNVIGFNYQPSYAYNSYEAWRFFDAEVFDREIGLGKKYFPNINTIRLWLSYDAFRYEEDVQAANFETALKICDKYNCKAIVCLFNCWHDPEMDNGGIYNSMMIPGSIWCAKENMYDTYFEKIVSPHKDDERILIWDICNEPLSYGDNAEYRKFMEPYENEWLKKMCNMCHNTGIIQPIGISHYASGDNPFERQTRFADYVDVFLIHPYYFYSDDDVRNRSQDGFEQLLNDYNKMAEKYGKPVLTTETCWGSRDNSMRSEIIKKTLSAHKNAEIGFLAHALHWSHVADLHNDEDGILGWPGNLMFITKDDKIREGHEVFNEF